MKPILSFVPWLGVPLAIVAGIGAARWRPGVSSANTVAPAKMETPPASQARQQPADEAVAGGVKSLADRVRKCGLKELPAIFEEISNYAANRTSVLTSTAMLDDRDRREMALRLLCARWADLDPQAGAAFFQVQERQADDRKQARKGSSDEILAFQAGTAGRTFLLTEWSLRDPAAAWENLKSQDPKDTARLAATVGRELVKDDTEGFWKWFSLTGAPPLAEWDPSSNWTAVIEAHFEEISSMAAEADVQPMDKDAAEKKSAGNPGSIYRLLAARRAEKDPDGALDWAAALPASVRDPAMQGVLKSIAINKEEAILDALLALKRQEAGAGKDGKIQTAPLVEKAVRTMASRDPLATVKWLQANQGKLQGNDMMSAMQEISGALTSAVAGGRLSARSVFDLACGTAGDFNGNLRNWVLKGMWTALPATSLSEAAGWLKDLNQDENQRMALKGLLPAWAKRDRGAALMFAADLNDRDISAGLWDGLLADAAGFQGTIADRNARASDALGQIPPEYRAGAAEKRMGYQFGDGMQEYSSNIDGPGISKALDGLPPSWEKTSALTRLADYWGTVDPAAALAWAGGQSDPELKEKTTAAVVESWARQDAWGASEWIKNLPPGGDRDSAANHLIKILSPDEPESAWTWAADIGDPVIRQAARVEALKSWAAASETSAQAALDAVTAELPPEDRGELQVIINQNRPLKGK